MQPIDALAAATEAGAIIAAINNIACDEASRDDRILIYSIGKSAPGLLFLALDNVDLIAGIDSVEFIHDVFKGLEAGELERLTKLRDLTNACQALQSCEATAEQCALIAGLLEFDANQVATAVDDLGFDGHMFVTSLLADRSWIVQPEQTEAEELAESQEEMRQINYERVLTTAIDDFKTKIAALAQDAVSKVYTDALPYAASDTESNIGFRIQQAIQNIVAGKFERVQAIGNASPYIRVEDDYGGTHLLSFNEYSAVVKPLVNAMRDELVNARIEQLEHEVESLRHSLSRRHI